MEKLRAIKENRIDLTDFLIHFTRIQDRKSAFEILKKIIEDGYLKTGWSQRGLRRTIFGKKPAVCFTESPLFAFVDYVKKRQDRHAIDSYGIALTRGDLFRITARNVIYGTTHNPKERKDVSGAYLLGDFPPEEQYRYVLTTDVDGKNDWMHEREWRWTYQDFLHGTCQELKIWYFDDDNYHFNPIVIIVKAEHERKELLGMFEKISIMADDLEKKNPVGWAFRRLRNNLINTGIITLDDIDFTGHPYYSIEYAIEKKEVCWISDHIAILKRAL